MLDAPHLSFSAGSSSFAPSEDTFIATKHRLQHAREGKLKTANTIELNGVDRSSFLDEGNPTRPASGITPYTPIKSLVSSPFHSKISSSMLQDRSFNESTPLDSETAHHSFLNAPQGNPKDYGASSLLKDKVRERSLQNKAAYTKPANQTLFSSIYERSVFRSRRMDSPAASHNYEDMSPLYNSAKRPKRSIPSTLPNAPQQNLNSTDLGLDDSYMKIALSRMVNKDYEIRRLIVCVVLFFGFKFVIALVRLAAISLELRNGKLGANHRSAVLAVNYLQYTIYGCLVLAMGLSIVRLLRPQDKCLDLPLSSKQRKILGLPPVPSAEDGREGETTFTGSLLVIPPVGSASNPTVLNLLNTTPHRQEASNSLDISRTFAGMNLASAGTNRSLARFSDAGAPTSPEKIKERLLSQRKRVQTPTGPHPSMDAANVSFKTPSGKFLYDLSNEDLLNKSFSVANASTDSY